MPSSACQKIIDDAHWRIRRTVSSKLAHNGAASGQSVASTTTISHVRVCCLHMVGQPLGAQLSLIERRQDDFRTAVLLVVVIWGKRNRASGRRLEPVHGREDGICLSSLGSMYRGCGEEITEISACPHVARMCPEV
jgi:hypothetical protein